jgi:hypothetical protein
VKVVAALFLLALTSAPTLALAAGAAFRPDNDDITVCKDACYKYNTECHSFCGEFYADQCYTIRDSCLMDCEVRHGPYLPSSFPCDPVTLAPSAKHGLG